MLVKNKILLHAWLALTLSVLFFYPLFVTLHDNDIILQWRIQNSLELIAAVAVFTLLLTGALWLIDKIYNTKIRFILFFLIFIIPFISFFTHFLRQLGFKENLINFGQFIQGNQLMAATIGIFGGALYLLLVIRYSRKMTHVFVMILLALSPLNLLAGWTLWSVRNVNTKIVINTPNLYEKRANPPPHNLIIILFDELSYEYLYKGGLINPQYLNFHLLSSISDNYHEATSPGNQTLTAIPGILMDRRYEKIEMRHDALYRITKKNKEEYLKIEPDNLFAIAKDKGYKTFAYGTYLPYCEMFAQSLDMGRSFSAINYATVEIQFSLINPIMTTFILWPHQKPQGFIKIPVTFLYQRKQTEQLLLLILKALDEKAPIFLFTHIYLPHQPFIFNSNGYYKNKEPYLENSENYQNQLNYVDHLLGELINKMKQNGIFESSEVIVLSDHNYRIMFPGRENHIPLIIKNPGQQTKKDVFEPVHVEHIIREILMQAEGPGS